MITCKLCNTVLEKKHLRKDGSLMCPVCGQIYWREAVRRALESEESTGTKRSEPFRRVSLHTVRMKPAHVAAR